MTATSSTLTWDPGARSSGTSLVGYLYMPFRFEETVARLITLSGQRDTCFLTDQYKVSVEFVGTFRGQVFTLYDYKEDRTLHIGGTRALDVDALNRVLIALIRTAAPTPYAAPEYYALATGHSFDAADVD